MSENDSVIDVLIKERQNCLERVNRLKLEIKRIKAEMAENRKQRSKLVDEVLKLEELRKKALARETLGESLNNTFGHKPAILELALSIFVTVDDYFVDKVTFDELYEFIQETFPKFSPSCPIVNQTSKANNVKIDAE